MLFNSKSFLLFFPIVCAVYFCIPSSRIRVRNMWLLVASYYFYMNWQPAYALLLLSSTVVTYLVALGIDHYRSLENKKMCLIGGIVFNLALLFLFKYYNFFSSNIEHVLQKTGLGIDIPDFHLLLPVGISFYTFQALGYSIDVYRGVAKVEKDFLTYALFVSFFPQLVAGPIERSNNLLPQFRQKHDFDVEAVMTGLKWMMWGYFLKLVLSDRCGIYVDAVYNNVEMHNGGSFLMAALLFTFQIYGDFAGYSLIAIGVARVLGFSLMENFHRPYLACTVGEFWHRWHISLSTWLKDYVYIPLGGSRVGRWRTYFNLLVTFIISGLWHGANWTFLCWGCLHGMILCLERALGCHKKVYHGINKYLHNIWTFILICVLWMLFRANSLTDFITIVKGIVTNAGFPYVQDVGWGVLIASFAAIGAVLVKDIAAEKQWFAFPTDGWACRLVQCTYIALLLAIISLFGVFGGNQFIYFQF